MFEYVVMWFLVGAIGHMIGFRFFGERWEVEDTPRTLIFGLFGPLVWFGLVVLYLEQYQAKILQKIRVREERRTKNGKKVG